MYPFQLIAGVRLGCSFFNSAPKSMHSDFEMRVSMFQLLELIKYFCFNIKLFFQLSSKRFTEAFTFFLFTAWKLPKTAQHAILRAQRYQNLIIFIHDNSNGNLMMGYFFCRRLIRNGISLGCIPRFAICLKRTGTAIGV